MRLGIIIIVKSWQKLVLHLRLKTTFIFVSLYLFCFISFFFLVAIAEMICCIVVFQSSMAVYLPVLSGLFPVLPVPCLHQVLQLPCHHKTHLQDSGTDRVPHSHHMQLQQGHRLLSSKEEFPPPQRHHTVPGRGYGAERRDHGLHEDPRPDGDVHWGGAPVWGYVCDVYICWCHINDGSLSVQFARR